MTEMTSSIGKVMEDVTMVTASWLAGVPGNGSGGSGGDEYEIPYSNVYKSCAKDGRGFIDECGYCMDRYILQTVPRYLEIAIATAGIIGNVLSLIVLFRDTKSNPAARILLRALAVADTCYLTCVGGYSVAQLYAAFYDQIMVANVYSYYVLYGAQFELNFIFASVWITVILAVTRYLAVCHPFLARRVTSGRFAWISLVLILISGIGFTIPHFYTHNVEYFPMGDRTFVAAGNDGPLGLGRTAGFIYHNIVYGIVRFYLPLVLICITSARLSVVLAAAHRRRSQLTNANPKERGSRDENLTPVLVAICVCYLLFNVFDRIIEYGAQSKSLCFFHMATLQLCQIYGLLINSSINFILYCAFRRQFRADLRALVCCCCPPGGRPTASTPSSLVRTNSGSASTINTQVTMATVN